MRDYYEQSAEREAERLSRPADGAVEWALHARALEEYLPPAPSRILDNGGGPGAWTLWLAHRGYQVTLTDLSPALLDVARARVAQAPRQYAANVKAVTEADARDLSAFPNASFDAQLCLGPLYHLTSSTDRHQAVREAHRVLRPGGLLIATVMPRYMRLVSTVLEHGSAAFTTGTVDRILDEGRYDDPRPGRFTGGYLTRPDDVAALFEHHGFRVRRLLASQGILAWAQPEAAALAQRDPDAYQRLLDVAYRTASDPSIHGMSGHLLVVAERLCA
ncbi:class I SAM-dependent methyltransferase [Streptomyces sp. Li-HN-5-11]|uniref:class I SAM-dependent methyltransferase n=1 Tax=Streptomyces sp. Li-HN-5-11 TaxID=3075432 RepID=UPI0028B132DE|nr:class I SAM-dependent methyltransferase [Streptomyces sp. Li-HN-5-11]WNM32813.1 class I SAM-dependent methyltransferase [Streptomyces sp. Li-HN-5-11]